MHLTLYISLLIALHGCLAQLEIANHDQIQTIPQKFVSDGLLMRFQPKLVVAQGCVRFPAVDSAGRISGGLRASGSDTGDCSRSTGQVYARSGEYGPLRNLGIMYSWFFPKAQQSQHGHRYDWQSVIVWLLSRRDPRVYQISWTVDGDWHYANSWHADGERPYISKAFESLSIDPGLLGRFYSSSTEPLIGWFDMPVPARASLNGFNFALDKGGESVKCHINERNFGNALLASWRVPP